MPYHTPTYKVLEELSVDPNVGVCPDEIEDRRRQFGANVFETQQKSSITQRFFEQIKDPMIIILLCAASVSLLLQEVIDSCIIVLVIVLNALIGVVQQYRSEQALEALPAPDPRFRGLTAAQAMEQAGNLSQQGQAHSQQRQQAKASRNRLSAALKLWVPVLGVGGLLLIILGFFLTLYPLSFVGFGCMAAAVLVAMVLVAKMGKYDRILYTPAPPQGENMQGALQRYLDWLTQRQQLEAQLQHAGERVADLEAQGAQRPTALVTPPTADPHVLTAQLRQVEGQMAQWQTRLDQATGALGRDTLEAESRRDELAGQIAQRQEEYQALTLALEGLEEANATLRQRFSPALNEKAGQLLARLTGGRHCGLTLARDLSAQVEQEGVQLPHSQLFLSSGAQEQLYLDALELLAEQARDRQVLLFSCHSRDAAWGAQHGANVTKLS